MANRRLFAKRARFSRQGEDYNIGRSKVNTQKFSNKDGPKQDIGFQTSTQGRILENGWRRENVSFAEAVKGSEQLTTSKIDVQEGKSFKNKEKVPQSEITKIIEVETEEELIQNLKLKLMDKRKEIGEEEGEEFSESSEEEESLESSDDDSPVGLSDEEFEEAFEDPIIRESSPEVENFDVKREEIIKKLNGNFIKSTDILDDKENLNDNDNAFQTNGGMLGCQLEKEGSPSPTKSAPMVDGNNYIETDFSTQRINSPIEDYGSFIKNTDSQQLEDGNTPRNKKGENKEDGGQIGGLSEMTHLGRRAVKNKEKPNSH
ncbi:hypothetical protein L2E82_18279 [Cichorium intybus]|uniref:Uncharacterized protein n=1 Tax=Cichorium intybus TaxID=13427 RepID=A0ACB9F9N5_CICIN|nr:hypothetical protein L2E82_18279 [Cichorium intybus]